MNPDNKNFQSEAVVEGDVNFSAHRQFWYAQREEKTRDILDRDAAVFMHQALSTPCLDVITHCQGSYFETQSGKRVLDFHGNSVHQIGFSHPVLVDRIKNQLGSLTFSTRRYTNEIAVAFAEKLGSLTTDNLNQVLLTPNGSSAVGIALKIARAVTGKYKVLSFWDSFHGASMDVAGVSGESVFQKYMGPIDLDVVRIPAQGTYRGIFEGNEERALEYLEYVLSKEPQIGAFLAETIRNTDVQIPSKNYWKRVRELCNRYGVLLILDEIPIALGRTGKWFAYEYFGITPDVVCLGKGLGGGIFPQAAVLTRREFNTFGDISLGHYTHEKSPLGALAGLTVIEVIESENLLGRTLTMESVVRKELEQLKQEVRLIGDVRGIGLLWGIELVKDRVSKKEAYAEAEKIMYYCLENGLNFKVSKGNVLQLCPPLTIAPAEMNQAINILKEAFKNLIIN